MGLWSNVHLLGVMWGVSRSPLNQQVGLKFHPVSLT